MAISRVPLTFLAFLAVPATTLAAPFCIQSEALPPQCIYYDADLCRKEAARQDAICAANNQLQLSTNVGQYCVVTSSGVSLCQYTDRGTCTHDATRLHGACTSARGVAPSGAPDPYAPVGAGY